ncbi:hypothetical protein JCM10207_007498 [Rhodosporidiobolus poonsookiae]
MTGRPGALARLQEDFEDADVPLPEVSSAAHPEADQYGSLGDANTNVAEPEPRDGASRDLDERSSRKRKPSTAAREGQESVSMEILAKNQRRALALGLSGVASSNPSASSSALVPVAGAGLSGRASPGMGKKRERTYVVEVDRNGTARRIPLALAGLGVWKGGKGLNKGIKKQMQARKEAREALAGIRLPPLPPLRPLPPLPAHDQPAPPAPSGTSAQQKTDTFARPPSVPPTIASPADVDDAVPPLDAPQPDARADLSEDGEDGEDEASPPPVDPERCPSVLEHGVKREEDGADEGRMTDSADGAAPEGEQSVSMSVDALEQVKEEEAEEEAEEGGEPEYGCRRNRQQSDSRLVNDARRREVEVEAVSVVSGETSAPVSAPPSLSPRLAPTTPSIQQVEQSPSPTTQPEASSTPASPSLEAFGVASPRPPPAPSSFVDQLAAFLASTLPDATNDRLSYLSTALASRTVGLSTSTEFVDLLFLDESSLTILFEDLRERGVSLKDRRAVSDALCVVREAAVREGMVTAAQGG